MPGSSVSAALKRPAISSTIGRPSPAPGAPDVVAARKSAGARRPPLGRECRGRCLRRRGGRHRPSRISGPSPLRPCRHRRWRFRRGCAAVRRSAAARRGRARAVAFEAEIDAGLRRGGNAFAGDLLRDGRQVDRRRPSALLGRAASIFAISSSWARIRSAWATAWSPFRAAACASGEGAGAGR